MARVSLLLPLALGLALAAAPAAAQTCFDLAPTITGAGKIKGTAGNDVILGSEFANDSIDGGGGYDYICSRGGDDRIKTKGAATIDAGDGDDRISVTSGSGFSTQISGGSGDDSIKFTNAGGGSTNEVLGGPGRDVIKVRTFAGGTMVDGGVDEDTIKFDGVAGSNQVTGGDGIDTCKLKGSVTSSGCEEQ